MLHASLVRQRPTEVLEMGGLWWRITQPGSSVGTRIYRQLVALAGEKVLHLVVDGMRGERAADEAERAAALWGPDAALRILRAAHAGEPIVDADLVDLQLALAALIAPAGIDRITSLGSDLLWESQLFVSKTKSAFTGPDTFGADRSDRATWERDLDSLIPDIATRGRLEVWAFLFLCRPSSAASRTAR